MVSLLQWLVDFVVKTMKRPDMVELDKEWTILEKVKTVIIDELEKNIGLLTAKLALCETQANVERDAGDKFNDIVKPFYIKSKKILSTLETKASAAKRKFTEMCVCCCCGYCCCGLLWLLLLLCCCRRHSSSLSFLCGQLATIIA